MRSTTCLPLLPGLLGMGLILSGCSETTSALDARPCSQDSECPESPASFCDPESSRCIAFCAQDADCSPQACRNGRCVVPPSAEAAASCQVLPDVVVGRSGMSIRFDLLVRDMVGKPLVPMSGITWAAATRAVIGGGTGTSATFTLAEPSEATEAVEAQVGNTVCRARVTVLRSGVPPGKVRVIVTDELTGRPLPGAVVAVSNAQADITDSSITDAQGVAWVPATGEVNLTVFHDAYGYLTLASYDTEKGIRDVFLPLRRNPLDLYGGERGTFVNVPASEDILLGFSGMSIPAMGFAVHERQIIGPSVPATMNILGKPQTLLFSTGTYVSLSSTVLRPEYTSPGVVGICDAELAGILSAEDAIRAGTCGTRASWALTGEVPLARLLSKDFDPEQSFLLLFMQNANSLRSFHSSIVRDVQFRLKPVPEHREYEDTAHYGQVSHDFQQLPLGLQFSMLVPTPPAYKDRLNRIIVVGTADVAGRGMTPLGLGFAVIPEASQAINPVRVFMAPTHHGLEGSPYRLLVIANSTAHQSSYVADSAGSVMIVPLPDLPTDSRTRPPMKLPGGFLPVLDQGNFNFLSAPHEGLQGREFRLTTDQELDDATLISVIFKSNKYRHWMVLMDPQRALAGVRLPIPPSRFYDRTRMNNDGVEGSRARLFIQALSTRKADGSLLDLKTLAEAEEASLSRMSDVITAISEHSHGIPGVDWVFPDKDDGFTPSIDHDTSVIVRIKDFHINSDPADDGHVQLSFQGGTGCSGQQLHRRVETNLAQAEVHFPIPSGCRGSRVLMTAALVDANNVPLDPPVANILTVNII